MSEYSFWQKVDILITYALARMLYYGARLFVAVLWFLFTGIVFTFIFKTCGFPLPF